MYAAIRQGKAKAGQAEELTRRIKEGAIPVISAVEGFMGYYVVYAPDDTVIAISFFNNYAAAEESNKRALAWIETDLAPLLTGRFRSLMEEFQGKDWRLARRGFGRGTRFVTVATAAIYAAFEESNKRALAWIEQDLAPLLTGPATAMAGPVIVHTLA